MDDLSGKINELLSDPESMQRIKNLAGMLTGSGTGGNNQGGYDNNSQNYSQQAAPNFGGFGAPSSPPPYQQQNGGPGDFNIDPDMIMKLSSAMRVMNQHDPRVDLLMALRENLTEPRQKKVDDAIKILRLLSLMPLLKEQGIFNF